MSIYEDLPKPFFVLAPMDDVTDVVFRTVIHKLAPADLYFTEFANVDGMQSAGRSAVEKKLLLGNQEGQVIAQLWGKTPENYYKTVKEIVDRGFAGIDINMGCPEKSIVNNGCCSGLINNRPLALEIIQAVKEAAGGKIPISVKTRLGFNEIDLSWHELLLQQGIDMLTVHGRTRKEMSKVPAHWDVIGDIVKLRDKIAPHTLIVGNGDVVDKQHGLALAEQYGVDGVMIGRGVFHNAYCFDAQAEKIKAELTPDQRKKMYKEHIELFEATWSHREHRPNLVTLNKFCKTYIQGFEGASELREKLMHASSAQELLAILGQ